MRVENTAKNINNYSEETLSLEKLKDGDYRIVAKSEQFEMSRPNSVRTIEMVFSQNGLNALLGSMMAISGNTKKD
ncbi:hypothetical protein [Vagococcus fluvialis]|uniref:hypothetical protein n=1 Tax=Vagococcus fluvialis TaxID=2738 RepID=UPI001432F4A3|nr:hypothetical protein [Vagococcus fluvialis]MBO0485929.1 hypothetical protein [Vagococcus fluvialis]MDT2747307.1 hypothetical protein [Vagococcus fluvialis]NKC60096.1 hypothetical protein [Vagococcus fluvialis]NKD50853.1 hypothetical protein [Vagococcus fluvialis]